ncbi:hypothetical protein [Mucilaginibacter sp. PAMB04168]|uniref:hypothetical protein n=1 Tax=Mucilaginibacter sp. PAMB04168 TaxID=3138567 RepID=UPI0031F67E2F
MKQIFTLLILGSLLLACGGPATDSKSADTTEVDGAKKEAGKSEGSSTKWNYTNEVDKMTSKKKYFASIDSDNQLDFEFPYDGGSTASILVRKQDNSNEVLLSVSKGQFIVGIDGGTVKVRFDDNKAMTFPCSEPSSGSSDLIFIGNEKKFIKNLKTAKKLLIQAEFYEAGLKEMEFSTAGFKWDH